VRNGFRWGWTVVVVIAISVLLPVATFLTASWLLGWRLQSVQSRSMEPTYAVGSLLVAQPVGPGEIETGMAVVFTDPAGADRLVAHRVVSVIHREDGLFFKTRGDANRFDDPFLVPTRLVEGSVRWSVPYLGRILGWLAWPKGLVVLVGIPGLVLVAAEVRDAMRRRTLSRAAPVQIIPWDF
jgi:signal peptidase